MNVKEAMNTARDYINAMFADEEIMQLGLEGVMYNPDAGQGRITFSFVRPWDRQNTMAVNSGLKTRAPTKWSIFTTATARSLPLPTACCRSRKIDATVRLLC